MTDPDGMSVAQVAKALGRKDSLGVCNLALRPVRAAQLNW
jgi:hypothetical protein